MLSLHLKTYIKEEREREICIHISNDMLKKIEVIGQHDHDRMFDWFRFSTFAFRDVDKQNINVFDYQTFVLLLYYNEIS